MNRSTTARIGAGAYVAPRARIEDDVVIGPDAVVLAHDSEDAPPTVVQHGADIGANVTVLPGLTVGYGSVVRPGSVVTRSVPARAIAEGDPAHIVGYVDADPPVPTQGPAEQSLTGPRTSRVKGVSLVELTTAVDMRGSLAVAELSRDVPFEPKRWFMVYGVPSAETRGQHAHRVCHQMLVAVAGSVRVVADDGRTREEFLLDRPTLALHLPAMVWSIQYDYSPDAVLLVLASEPYDAADYVRDYAEYLELADGPEGPGST